jgi:uncharacterized protein
MIDMAPDLLVLLFFVAGTAGCIDALAGGGGLIVLPVLLSIGMPPTVALATNKLQATGGSLAATVYFVRSGTIDLRRFLPVALLAFAGALSGAALALHVGASSLRIVLPIVLIGIAAFVSLTPGFAAIDKKARISLVVYAVAAAPLIGFYDGFLGPGTGTFLCLSMAGLLGFSMVKATAHAKLLNFASNAAALGYFAIAGQVHWLAGFVMLAGQVGGGWVGARLVLTKGRGLIRAATVVMCVALSIKLLADRF